MSIRDILSSRIALLDGALGTQIQSLSLSEEDFRGSLLADHPTPLKGNNDLLTLTRPDDIRAIHRAYLEAGADIISTCTFNAQRISQSEYHTENLVRQINLAGASLARAEADRMTQIDPSRPRFVAGSVGPTSKMLSIPDRLITFDQLEEAYFEQISALIEGGVDIILIETVFDTLNAKAALSATSRAIEAVGRSVEVMVSASISSEGGRLLSGQSIEAFVCTLTSYNLLSVGLNCSFGADLLLRPLNAVAQYALSFVSVHPNAGLPNAVGQYDVTPEIMAQQMTPFIQQRLVNIIGGCCGTTPDHIRHLRQLIDLPDSAPRVRPEQTPRRLILSGSEPSVTAPDVFFNVGERCNVAGSRKFLRLISEESYDQALQIAADQVSAGAMAIDVNMDDPMIDTKTQITRFLDLIAADPVASRVPVMVDSSRFDVIEAALKHIPGKGIVNSISLKEGEDSFLKRAEVIKRLGAAVVVMAFDEKGQATTFDRKIEVCQRAYRLLVNRAGFNPSDIIFDPNILTVATGIDEHNDYAFDFVRASRWISDNLPGARVSGGVSNLSFAFRGLNAVREAMHAAFLFRAISQGSMSMAIMNPSTAIPYDSIDPKLLQAINDALFDRRDSESVERLTNLATQFAESNKSADKKAPVESPKPLSVAQRLSDAIIRGATASLADDLQLALDEFPSPLAIVEGPLMQAMLQIGRQFAEGKVFLPQVVKTAQAMKTAVDILRPAIQATLAEGNADGSITRAGRILLATVRGDVHDIGKNIAATVLTCNNFEVIDLGVMVEPDVIVREAINHNVDIIGLSGLITPSLDEMARVASSLQQAGLKIPLLIGGATTSPLHTALSIAPLYDGPVVHVADASADPVVAAKLIDPDSRQTFIDQIRSEQQALRDAFNKSRSTSANTPDPLSLRHSQDWASYSPFRPPFNGVKLIDPIPVSQLIPLIDWLYFYHAWRTKPDTPQGRQLSTDAQALLNEIANDTDYALPAIVGFFDASATDDAIIIDGIKLFTPRQPYSPRREQCLSLCDFVSPLGNDTVGAFAATVPAAMVQRAESLFKSGDEYNALICRTVADRLAEAASTYLHRTLANDIGIRPAVGYPSLPDQSAIFTIDRLLKLNRIGISLTVNGAMTPQASVAGLYILNPSARYFSI